MFCADSVWTEIRWNSKGAGGLFLFELRKRSEQNKVTGVCCGLCGLTLQTHLSTRFATKWLRGEKWINKSTAVLWLRNIWADHSELDKRQEACERQAVGFLLKLYSDRNNKCCCLNDVMASSWHFWSHQAAFQEQALKSYLGWNKVYWRTEADI